MIPQELKNNLHFKKILKYCSLGIRSESEILDKLKTFELDEDLKELIFNTLKKNKFFFGNEEYIERFLENLSSTKGYSKIQLKQKLLKKKLPLNLITEKIDGFYKENGDTELEKFVSKNYKKLQNKEPRARVAFLMSKGFNYDKSLNTLKKFDL